MTVHEQVVEACEEIVRRFGRNRVLYPETRVAIMQSPDPLAYGREFAARFGVGPVRKNAVWCPICQQEIESKNRHDFRECRGGHIAVDGGTWYCRRVGSSTTEFVFENRSTVWPWSEEGVNADEYGSDVQGPR